MPDSIQTDSLCRRFRRARSVRSRPKTQLTARLDAERIADNALRDIIRAEIDAGADARALYAAANEPRRRVLLLGVLRRGTAALAHID